MLADGTPGRALALAESLLDDPGTNALGRVAAGIVAHRAQLRRARMGASARGPAGHLGAARARGVRAVRPRPRSRRDVAGRAGARGRRPAGRRWPRAGTRSSPPSSDTGTRSLPAGSSTSSTSTSAGTSPAGRRGRCTATGCGHGSQPTPTRRPLPPRRASARCSRSWTTGIRVRPAHRPTSAITSRASPRSRMSYATAACASTATASWSICSRRSETGRDRSSRATISTPTSR